MPRRNENARSRGPAVNDIWRLAELKAMSEHIDKKIGLRQVQEGRRQNSVIKTTGESIVRDFRKTEGVDFYKDLESMRPLFRPPRRPFFLKRWINAVNWWLVMNRACWAALIGCLIYLGIFVFAPFTAKLLR